MRTKSLLTSTVVVSVLIGACNGEIRTKIWNAEELQKELVKEEGVRGVIGYYTKSIIEVSRLTQFVDTTDNTVTGDCNRVDVQKIVVVTDYEHPYQIYYKYGLLEGNNFSVQMNNNVITAINSSSAPDQGRTFANLAQAFSLAAGAVPFIAESRPGGPDCNSGPSFVGYRPLPNAH